MALVFTAVTPQGIGERKDLGRTLTDVTLDATSYSAGFAVTAAQLRLQTIDTLNVQNSATVPAVTFTYDQPNSKIRAFKTGAATSGVLLEAVAGDFSTSNKIRVEAIGAPVL